MTSDLLCQDDATNRESNVDSDSDLTNATSTNEQKQAEGNSSELMVWFEENQAKDPADAVPTLDEYLKEEAPELLDRYLIKNKNESCPQTRQFTGTQRV